MLILLSASVTRSASSELATKLLQWYSNVVVGVVVPELILEPNVDKEEPLEQSDH